MTHPLLPHTPVVAQLGIISPTARRLPLTWSSCYHPGMGASPRLLPPPRPIRMLSRGTGPPHTVVKPSRLAPVRSRKWSGYPAATAEFFPWPGPRSNGVQRPFWSVVGRSAPIAASSLYPSDYVRRDPTVMLIPASARLGEETILALPVARHHHSRQRGDICHPCLSGESSKHNTPPSLPASYLHCHFRAFSWVDSCLGRPGSVDGITAEHAVWGFDGPAANIWRPRCDCRAGRLPVVHTGEVKDDLDLNGARVMANLCALRCMAAVGTGDGWGSPRRMQEES